MVEAEQLAEAYLNKTIAEKALACFAALKEAKAAKDDTALKVLQPMADQFAKLVLDENEYKDAKKGKK